MKNFLAQQINVGGQGISGPLVVGGKTDFKLADIVSEIVKFLIPLGGVILLFVMIWGGYDFMMSRGNPEKMKSAQAKITTGIIGFVLLVFAYVIAKLIATIFGVGEGIL